MKIELYKFTNEKIAVNKSLSSKNEFEGTLRESCSVINPAVKLEASNLSKYNYAYIPEFNRWYFIDNITSVLNGLWELSMHVDVLYTYRSNIYAQPAIVARNASKFNLYLADSMFKAYVNPTIQVLEAPSGFNNSYVHILATNGGGAA